jgi:clan AA aspartic protease
VRVIGLVSQLHALVSIPFRVLGQPDIAIEFVVDTGFAGFLTLPTPAISALHLPLIRAVPANLADDSSVLVFVHAATIDWNGEEREVEVMALGRRPLLGTLLLDGHDLAIQFADGGLVTIDRL